MDSERGIGSCNVAVRGLFLSPRHAGNTTLSERLRRHEGFPRDKSRRTLEANEDARYENSPVDTPRGPWRGVRRRPAPARAPRRDIARRNAPGGDATRRHAGHPVRRRRRRPDPEHPELQAGIDKPVRGGRRNAGHSRRTSSSAARSSSSPASTCTSTRAPCSRGRPTCGDYPKGNTRIEGHSEPWLPALVNADHVDHLRITGEGTLDGSGAPFWAAFWKRRKENPDCTNLEVERPRLLFIQDCQDVRVSGLTLKDSGFWNLHLYRCRDVVLERLDIHVAAGPATEPPSSDGMDLDSCQHVDVRDCTFAGERRLHRPQGHQRPVRPGRQGQPAGGARPHLGMYVQDRPRRPDLRQRGHDRPRRGHGPLHRRGRMPLLHLKLRPDTPQEYRDIHVRDVVLRDGSVFDVSPWTQFSRFN